MIIVLDRYDAFTVTFDMTDDYELCFDECQNYSVVVDWA
jgi:hypothetical protein